MADIAFQSKVIAIPSITTKEEAMTHLVAKSQRKVGKKISLATAQSNKRKIKSKLPLPLTPMTNEQDPSIHPCLSVLVSFLTLFVWPVSRISGGSAPIGLSGPRVDGWSLYRIPRGGGNEACARHCCKACNA